MPGKLDPGDGCQLGESPVPTRSSHKRLPDSSVILLNFSPTCASRDEGVTAKAKWSLGSNATDSFRLRIKIALLNFYSHCWMDSQTETPVAVSLQVPVPGLQERHLIAKPVSVNPPPLAPLEHETSHPDSSTGVNEPNAHAWLPNPLQ